MKISYCYYVFFSATGTRLPLPAAAAVNSNRPVPAQYRLTSQTVVLPSPAVCTLARFGSALLVRFIGRCHFYHARELSCLLVFSSIPPLSPGLATETVRLTRVRRTSATGPWPWCAFPPPGSVLNERLGNRQRIDPARQAARSRHVSSPSSSLVAAAAQRRDS
jgi:hypothetical protein